jgi:hypothetical protein
VFLGVQFRKLIPSTPPPPPSPFPSKINISPHPPITDVTPYDSVPSAAVPSWCGSLPPGAMSGARDLSSIVQFNPGLETMIHSAASERRLRFYDNGADVCQTIRELLASDVRPEQAYRRWKSKVKNAAPAAATDSVPSPAKPKRTCRFRFDMLLIGFIRTPEDGIVAQVVDVVVEDEATDKALRAGKTKRYTEDQ